MKSWISYTCAILLLFTSTCSPMRHLNRAIKNKDQSFNFTQSFPNVNLSLEASFMERAQNFFSRLAGNPTIHPLPITGRFFVDGSGHSNYSIPLQLPPNVSRVGVNLSLNYNSGFLNGYVGFGWRLAGFSQVTLCSQNYFFDQTWSNVRTNDPNLYQRNRFCLDGQRLVAIQGSYGGDGTIYHTETFNGMRVKSIGRCGNGPCSFQIFDRKGNQRTYGANDDSKIIVTSSIDGQTGDILTWALDQILDLDDRKIDFFYSKGGQFDNTLYPLKITYGISPNDNITGARTITFNYENSPQITQQNKYLALTTLQTQPEKRLESITSAVRGDIVTAYNFQYKYNSFSRRNRLTEISYCDNVASTAIKCFAHTNFEYPFMQQPSNNVSFVQSNSTVLGNFQENGVKFVLMDKYATGHPGIGVIFESNGSSQFQFFKNDGTGQFSKTEDNMLLGDWGYDANDLSKNYDFRVLDKNGDGINDLVKIQKGGGGEAIVYSYLSGFNQNNFRSEVNPTLLNNTFDTENNIHYILKDLNGDGLSDLAQLDPTQSSDSRYNITLFYSAMAGGFPNKNNITQKIKGYVMPYKNAGVDFVDLNGDSLVDLHLLVNANGESLTGSFNVLGLSYYHYKGNFTGPQNSQSGVQLGNNSEWNALPVYKWFDFNNDGLKDLLLLSYQGGVATGELFTNTGGLYSHILSNNRNQNIVTNSFILSEKSTSLKTPDQSFFRNIVIGDIDGDGYQDLMHHLSKSDTDSSGNTITTNNSFSLFKNTGNTFSSLNQTQDFGDNSKNYPLDLNGDGVMDILNIQTINGQAIARSFINSTLKQYDHIIKIHNGIGRVINLNYGQLSSVHDIDTNNMPQFPYIIYQQPRIVVHSYSDQNGAGTDYSYERKFNLRYTNGIFNRHNWQFSGFQKVDNHESARDIIESRNYKTTHPFNRLVKSIEIRKGSTGELFSGSYFNHDFQDIYSPNDSPTVKLVRKISSYKAIYHRPKGSNIDQEAFRNVEEFGFADISTMDGKYGNIMSKTQYSQNGNNKSDALNYCYSYLNKIESDNWALGFKTGERVSKESSCRNFTNPQSYLWDEKNDLRLLYNIYDEDKLRVINARSYSYNPNNPNDSGWVGSSYTYNDQGRLQTAVQNSAYANSNGQYPLDNKETIISFGYDDYGFVSSRQYKSLDQLSKQIKVDPRFGRISSITYPSGVHIRAEFDELGLLNQVFANDPTSNTQKQVEDYSYVSNGSNIYSLKKIRTNWDDDNQDNWHYQKVYYDGNQSMHKMALRGFNEVDRITQEYRRDFNTGRTSHTAFPYYDQETPTLAAYTYDQRGRLQTITRDDGLHVSYNHSYDAGTSSRNIQIPSPAGSCNQKVNRVTLNVTYDHLQRRLSIMWSDKSTIQRHYNLFSRQIEFKDGRGLSHSWTYDSLGRVVGHRSPDLGETTVQYDAHSRPLQYEFSDGRSLSIIHDGLGRLISRTATMGNNSSIESYKYSELRGDKYHNMGQLTSLSLSNGMSMQYNYDFAGNMAHQIIQDDNLSAPQQFTFQYSPLKQKVMMTYPDQSSLHWNYAKTGELQTYQYKEEANIQNLVTVDSYNPTGSVALITYGNQVSLSYNFDQQGRVTQLAAGNSNSNNQTTNFLTHNYCYNTLGLKAQRIINNKGQNTIENFVYDIRGRMSSYTNGSQSNAYKYDNSGNLLQKKGINLTISSKNNQITGGIINDSQLSTSYDQRGRLLRKELQKDRQTSKFNYNYDAFGRLANYTFPQGRVNYKYGINGYRFSREMKVDNNTTQMSFYVSPFYEIHKVGATTTNIKNMQLGSLTLASSTGGQMKFFVRDHLGSLLSTTNASGASSSIQQYSPYGNLTAGQLSASSEFAGRRYDSELRHYDFIHRNYDPELGRFLTPDPMRQYASGYGYAGAQPLNTVDRNGLEFGEFIASLIASAITAVTAIAVGADVAGAEVAGAVTAGSVGAGVAGADTATSVVAGTVATETVATTQGISTALSTEVSVSTTASLSTSAAESISGTVGFEGSAELGSTTVESNTFIEGALTQTTANSSAEIEFSGQGVLNEGGQLVGSGLEETGSSLAETGGEEVGQVGSNAANQSTNETANEAGQVVSRPAREALRSIGRRFITPAAKFLAHQAAGLVVFGVLPTLIQQLIEKHHPRHEQNQGLEYGNDGLNQNFSTNTFFQRPNRRNFLVNTYSLSTSLGTPYGTTQARSERAPTLGFPSVNTRGLGLISISDPQYFNEFHQERRRAVDYSQILIDSRRLGNHYPIYISY